MIWFIVLLSILNNRWKEKSQVIGQLEKQVTEMRDNWESKERRLTSERDKAIEAARLVTGSPDTGRGDLTGML